MPRNVLETSMDLTHKTILIVKLRYIGDTLSIVPVVENLTRLAPGAAVDVLVNRGTESVLAYHPEIRAVRVYDYGLVKKSGARSLAYQARLIRDLRSAHYDIVIDYTHGDRAALLCRLTGAPVRITHDDRLFIERREEIQHTPYRIDMCRRQCHEGIDQIRLDDDTLPLYGIPDLTLEGFQCLVDILTAVVAGCERYRASPCIRGRYCLRCM